jgi:cell volume regulation protein A
MSDGVLLLATGALLAGALAASLLASRLRIPGLVVVLGIGMAVGSDGAGWIHFDDYRLAETIGVIALALILFEGGLAAGLGEIRPVLGPAVSLAILGTLITAVIAGLAAAWLFDFSTLEGLLVGSIVASTDGAAIFALLRGSTLRRRVARTLEGEAGLNDPVAVLLVLGFIDWIQKPNYGVADMVGLFVQQVGIGLAVGVVAGVLAVGAMRRVRLASAGLYPVASLAAAALAYGAAATLHGSGFLAVYLCGLALGSAPTPATRTITTFHDGLAWIAQISLFLALGLLVFPAQLGGVAVEGTVLALVVAVVARPVAVFIATALHHFSFRERLVLGWAGLRGAVPVVLAIFPVVHHVPDSLEFFNIAFFAVVLSTVVQGATFVGFAERLGVTTNEAALPTPLMEAGTIRRLGAETVEFPVRAGDAVVGRRVREIGLPREALLNVIVRGQQAIPPRGSTLIEAGDRLHVLVRQEVAVEFRRLLELWRTGPLGGERRHAVTRGSTVFSTRPWRYEDGDPSRPQTVGSIAVVEQLRTRRDAAGALVALADGRFAYTGRVMAVGSAQQVQDAARRRLRSCDSDADAAWWREVIGALAVP